MGYLVNDALDELLDLIAGLLWPGAAGDPAAEAPRSKASRVVGPRADFELAVQRLGEGLPNDFVPFMPSQARLGPLRPKLSLTATPLSFGGHSKGLLGRLVAHHIAVDRVRALYMVRNWSSSWDDDTPIARYTGAGYHVDLKTLSKGDAAKELENPDGRLSVLRYSDRYARWNDGKKSPFGMVGGDMVHWSLEQSFTNWSAPFWGDWMYTRHVFGSRSARCKGSVNESARAWNRFVSGDGTFLDWMLEAESCHVFEGVKKISDGRNFWANFDPGRGLPIADLHRDFERPSERIMANYKFKAVFSRERTAKEVWAYYRRGYYLVRAALDVLLARMPRGTSWEKATMKSLPARFVEHCNWWMIAPPSRIMLNKLKDLSSIGAGPSGFANITDDELIDYVIKITPKPGTIEPWNDNGPCWLWPSETGHMEPLTMLPVVAGRNDPLKGVYDEISWVSNAVSTVASACGLTGMITSAITGVINQAVSAGMEYLEKWLADGMQEILGEASSRLSESAMGLLGEIAAVGADMAQFVEAKDYYGLLDVGSNLPVALDDYMGAMADNMPDRFIKEKEAIAKAQLERLRSWDWSDDLFGSVSSLGSARKLLSP